MEVRNRCVKSSKVAIEGLQYTRMVHRCDNLDQLVMEVVVPRTEGGASTVSLSVIITTVIDCTSCVTLRRVIWRRTA